MTMWQSTTDRSRNHTADEIEEAVHQRIIRGINESEIRNLDKEQARVVVERSARAVLAEQYPDIVGDLKEDIVAHVVDDVTGLGPIEALVLDPDVSEIMVNAPDEIFFERDGIIHQSDAVFKNEEHIRRIIDRIISPLGRHVDDASAMVDARLDDGSRVNVIIPPLVPRSPVLTIRKFRADLFSMTELIQRGTISQRMAEFLAGCVSAKLNIVISGGTGTGKTTLLNAMSGHIGERERIITIEDPIEMKLQQRHVIQMEARPPSIEGTGEVTQRMLLRNALRMRPDRIILGEVRGPEAFDMMQAMNSGHEGSLTTVHANSPRDALGRIENMVLTAGFELPVTVIREQMSAAFHLLVHIARMLDGTRRVIHISEISGQEGNTISLQDIFTFRQAGLDADGRVLGDLHPTGIRPHFTDRLQAFGVELGPDAFGVGRWG